MSATDDFTREIDDFLDRAGDVFTAGELADTLEAAGYRKVDGEVEAQRIVADEWASAAKEWSHQVESITAELEKERRYSAKVDAAFAALKRQHAKIDVELVDAKAAQVTPNPAECDHEFTDHCVFCGVDAHEWFNHYAEGSWV